MKKRVCRTWRSLSLLPFLFVAVILSACTNASGPKTTSGTNASGAMVKINGKALDLSSISTRERMSLYQIENERFQKLRGLLDKIVETQLMEEEAKSQGISVKELQHKEIIAKMSPVTEKEVDAFYKEREKDIQKMLKQRYKGQKQPSVDELKQSISQQLVSRRQAEASQAYLANLKKKYKVEYLVKEPEAPRVEVSAGDNPFKGSKNAKVSVIEFSDFECPYCRRAVPILKQIEEEYGDDVKIVFRDFPLSFHRTAKKQAEGGGCSNDQGKFWEYHDKLFEEGAQAKIKQAFTSGQEKGLENKLADMAKEVGVDRAKFAECLASGKYKQEVEKDIQDGVAAGIASTPSFVINGRLIAGAQPFPEFKRIIDEELKK